ncbi:MAG: (d)CMP kinase [Rickettsiaceae bacterium]|nr:(d)CMP kinase [Rickettsiaceae bacterium]
MKKFIIALDGPSGAGKSLIGRMIAAKYSLRYFPSSWLYRYLAYSCRQLNIKPDEIGNIIKLASKLEYLYENNNLDLNTEEIGNYASKVAAIEEIREIINIELQNIIAKTNRIIMEGRDIGSVVAVNAHLKIYLTADIKIRAERRYKQLCSEGKECILSDILSLIQERDARDKAREFAPLIVANNSLVIDSSHLTPEEIMLKIEQHIVTHNAAELL